MTLPLNPSAFLAHFPKLTYRRFKKLLAQPHLLEHISDLELVDLSKAGWEEGIAQDFITWREQTNPEILAATLSQEGISTLAWSDPHYPALLKELPDPPAVLFIRGSLRTNDERFAMVGTRKTTPYGKQLATDFAGALASQGLTIVSGLALGTDSFVHEATLNAGGITIAVLGSGVDRSSLYPRAHHDLAERIIAHGGAIISEYPPGFLPTPYSFPARNRIIAGLCRATLVTEAPVSSGALITARAALDYNREVMAIPHPITSVAGAGTNLLIKQGAQVVLSPPDVLELLNIQTIEKTVEPIEPQGLSDTENQVLSKLQGDALHIDRLSKESGLPSAVVATTLLMLEMKGLVRNTGGQHYQRLR